MSDELRRAPQLKMRSALVVVLCSVCWTAPLYVREVASMNFEVDSPEQCSSESASGENSRPHSPSAAVSWEPHASWLHSHLSSRGSILRGDDVQQAAGAADNDGVNAICFTSSCQSDADAGASDSDQQHSSSSPVALHTSTGDSIDGPLCSPADDYDTPLLASSHLDE